jgi:hypothetical protein
MPWMTSTNRDVPIGLDVSGQGPGISGMEVGGWTSAATPEGQNPIACWLMPEGRIGVLLTESVVDGPSAAADVPRLGALVRALSELRADPAWILARANTHLHLDGGRHGLTAFLGCLSADGRLSWCSAGQGPVYVRSGDRGAWVPRAAQWPPLGVEPGLPPKRAAIEDLQRGGRVAVLSEGILDAANGSGQPLGPQRVKTMLDGTDGVPLERTLEIVRDVLLAWQGGEAPGVQAMLIAGRSE